MFELKSTSALCDIWRRSNPKIKILTFGQNYGADFIEDRIDLFSFKCFARVYLRNRCLIFVLQ